MFRPSLRSLPRALARQPIPVTLRYVSTTPKVSEAPNDAVKQVKIGGGSIRLGAIDLSSARPSSVPSGSLSSGAPGVGGSRAPLAIPKEAVIYGGAGLLPYAATSLGSVFLAQQAGLATEGFETLMSLRNSVGLLYHLEILQVQYGAIILSFLGALHWGFEFAGYAGSKGHARYLIGIAPVMLAWGSLLIGGPAALATQFVGFVGLWFVDMKATKHGWMPEWYALYRTILTSVVGSSLLITLAGVAYFGPSKKEAKVAIKSEVEVAVARVV